MLADPVDALAADLPFVNPSAGPRFSDAIRQIFANPAELTQSMMLHFQAKNGPVLLEMVANVFGVNDGQCVVMTGREVDCDLATLMCGNETDRASESNISMTSKISSITMATLYQPPLEPASKSEPVFLDMVGDAVRTDSEGVVASPSSTTFATMLSRVMKGREVTGLIDDEATSACESVYETLD